MYHKDHMTHVEEYSVPSTKHKVESQDDREQKNGIQKEMLYVSRIQEHC